MNWLLNLARHQIATSEVPVFGVILYTDADAHVKKALRDDDYWRGLDKSSEKWTIFSIRAYKGEWEYPTPPPGVLAMMVPVWREPEANLQLLEAFGLESTEGLPALAVFGIDNGEMLRHISMPIDDTNEAMAYSSLKTAINVVNTALSSSIRRNIHGVFDELEKSVSGERGKVKAIKAYKILKELRDWLPFV